MAVGIAAQQPHQPVRLAADELPEERRAFGETLQERRQHRRGREQRLDRRTIVGR